PWTLPANTALAVNPDMTYLEVTVPATDETSAETFVVAKDLAETVLTNAKHQPLKYKVLREFSGEELVGKVYQPLFNDRGKNAHKVWAADYVTTESGTGIVHIAPAYGEEDFALSREKDIPVVHTIDEIGIFTKCA